MFKSEKNFLVFHFILHQSKRTLSHWFYSFKSYFVAITLSIFELLKISAYWRKHLNFGQVAPEAQFFVLQNLTSQLLVTHQNALFFAYFVLSIILTLYSILNSTYTFFLRIEFHSHNFRPKTLNIFYIFDAKIVFLFGAIYLSLIWRSW